MSEILIALLVVIGSAFMLLAAVGVLRFPDVFTRIQATAKASTMGPGCILLAVAISFGDLGMVTRAALVAAFIFLTVPVSAHMIARAAHLIGTPLWEQSVANELRDHQQSDERQTVGESNGDDLPADDSSQSR